jgi:tetratricopeptide (TPR) repeat protein/TolB-like protein
MFIRRLYASLCVTLLILAALPGAARAQSANDVVIVLPFENMTNQREFNWVGESFADSLAELLKVPGLSVVSGDERELAYQRLGLRTTILPSRATSIKIAREARATLVVMGTYEITPAQDESTVATVRGSARVVRVNEGRLTGVTMPDGRWATHEYFFGDALVNLQTMQGKLAFQILVERDRALPVAQNEILQKATKVPPKAFESYVKGAMTDPSDKEKKSAYLQNAMREYARTNAGAVYPQAAFELGHLYFDQGDWKNAAEHFSMLQKKEPHYAEAAFYAALSYWRQDDMMRALGALMPLSTEMPLTSIYNNVGAISTQAARAERDAKERERLLQQAIMFLGRAADSAPDDPTVRYNYAYALLLTGKYTEAADRLRPVIANNPRDGEALFLFAKALERAGQTEPANVNDNEARKFLPQYAKVQLEWQKSQTVSGINLRLYQEFNLPDYINAIRHREPDPEAAKGTNTEDLLVKARELYAAGRDEEALPELRRVVMVEPMNAEAYLLTGRIYQRRGELETAINQLKTSIFWDPKLIDAHVLLGRIFFERGDRAMALAYARSAMQIDPNNQEAIALRRQVEIGAR